VRNHAAASWSGPSGHERDSGVLENRGLASVNRSLHSGDGGGAVTVGSRTDPQRRVGTGPDKASMRFGVRLGFRERLAALESLLDDAGYRAKSTLKTAYTRKWLDGTLGEMAVIESRERK
jgi:hypothetical protein